MTRYVTSGAWREDGRIDYLGTGVVVPLCLCGTFCGVMMGVVWPEAYVTVILDLSVICIMILTLYRGMKLQTEQAERNGDESEEESLLEKPKEIKELSQHAPLSNVLCVVITVLVN